MMGFFFCLYLSSTFSWRRTFAPFHGAKSEIWKLKRTAQKFQLIPGEKWEESAVIY